MERKGIKWKAVDLPKELNSLQEEGFLALEEIEPTQSPVFIYGSTEQASVSQKVLKRKKRRRGENDKGAVFEESHLKKVKPSKLGAEKKKLIQGAYVKDVKKGGLSLNGDGNCTEEEDATSTADFVSNHSEGEADASTDTSAVEACQLSKCPEDAANAAFEVLCDSYEMVPQLIESLPDWTDALGGDITLLHPAVARVLLDRGFVRPTPVQRLSLVSAARDRKDVVACSQTGTGKTLAFGLPVVSSLAHQLVRRVEKWQDRQQKLIQQALEQGLEEPQIQSKGSFLLEQIRPNAPAALVLEPTRELALQVYEQLKSLCAYTPIRCSSVVGGLSPEKQLRVLGSTRPFIVVATPGRLLALVRQQILSHQTDTEPTATAAASDPQQRISNKSDSVGEASSTSGNDTGASNRRARLEHEGAMFAANFSALQFLILDEADRLLIQSRMKFAKRHKAKGTKRKRREAAPTETQELLQLIYHQLDNADMSIPRSSVKLGLPALAIEGSVGRLSKTGKAKEAASGKLRGRAASLQTFVLSATLAMALQRGRQGLRLLKSNGKGDGRGDMQKGNKSDRTESDEDDCAAALLQHVRVRPKCLLAVNVLEREQQSFDSKQEQQLDRHQEDAQQSYQQTVHHNSSKLPQSLRLSVWKCPRDSELETHLAAFLLRVFHRAATARTGCGMKIVVFVNSISYVYRLEPIFNLLLSRHKEQGVEVEICGLHSNLQQKQRLKRLERFSKANMGVLVSTDVAARGLDFKRIDKVVHLQRPRDTETFVHRSGRTARAGCTGEAVCFVVADDVTKWLSILGSCGIELAQLPPPADFEDISSLQSRMETMHRLFELVNKIEQDDHQKARAKRTHGVMRRMALAADVELDSEFTDSENEGVKGQQKKWKIQAARKHLQQLLATYVP